jgi:hypothetical protein
MTHQRKSQKSPSKKVTKWQTPNSALERAKTFRDLRDRDLRDRDHDRDHMTKIIDLKTRILVDQTRTDAENLSFHLQVTLDGNLLPIFVLASSGAPGTSRATPARRHSESLPRPISRLLELPSGTNPTTAASDGP